MNNEDTVQLFHKLLKPYPAAAAGLLEDLCSSLAKMVHLKQDKVSIDSMIGTIGKCFRTLNSSSIPDCAAWDQLTFRLSGWLNQDCPRLKAAVQKITEWSAEEIVELKEVFPRVIRANRDDYNQILKSNHF